MSAAASRAGTNPTDLITDPRLLAVLLVTFTGTFNARVVPVAIPGISEAFAVPDTQIGLVMTSFFLATATMLLIVGVVADLYGRRAAVLPSLAVFGVASVSIFFATSFEMLLALRVLQGAAFPAITPLATAVIGDLYTGPQGTTAQGLKSSANGVSALFGPAVAGVLAGIGWQYPFLVGFLAFPVLLVVYFALPETAPPGEAGPGSMWRRLRAHFAATWAEFVSVDLKVLFVIAAIGFGIRSTLVTFIPLFAARELGAGAFAIGLILSTRGAVRVPVAPISGAVVARFGRRRALVGAFGGIAVTAGLFAASTSVLVLGAVMVGYSFADSLFTPILNDSVVSLATDERRSSVVTANSVFKTFSNAIAPAVFGLVLAASGFTPVFLLCGGLAVVAAVTVVVAYDGR